MRRGQVPVAACCFDLELDARLDEEGRGAGRCQLLPALSWIDADVADGTCGELARKTGYIGARQGLRTGHIVDSPAATADQSGGERLRDVFAADIVHRAVARRRGNLAGCNRL